MEKSQTSQKSKVRIRNGHSATPAGTTKESIIMNGRFPRPSSEMETGAQGVGRLAALTELGRVKHRRGK